MSRPQRVLQEGGSVISFDIDKKVKNLFKLAALRNGTNLTVALRGMIEEYIEEKKEQEVGLNVKRRK